MNKRRCSDLGDELLDGRVGAAGRLSSEVEGRGVCGRHRSLGAGCGSAASTTDARRRCRMVYLDGKLRGIVFCRTIRVVNKGVF